MCFEEQRQLLKHADWSKERSTLIGQCIARADLRILIGRRLSDIGLKYFDWSAEFYDFGLKYFDCSAIF